MVELRGITWAHPRGYTPLVAASEAWNDRHPETRIAWTKRSLWGFGEGPLDEVAREYDLIVFDHPHTGLAAERGLLCAFDNLAEQSSLTVLEANSVGRSFESYRFDGHVYGLPIDAACQMAACREDLFGSRGIAVPRTWEDTIALARENGAVRCAFGPMGTLGMFHTLCAAGGGNPGRESEKEYVAEEVGAQALRQLRDLFEAVGPQCLTESPVGILRAMSNGNDIIFAPLLYGYSNYCRAGFARHPLRFLPPPVTLDGSGSTLGGAGLGVSAFSKHQPEAAAFACWVAGYECQSSLYLLADGQPALRSVWQSDLANMIGAEFFRDCLPVAEKAYVRINPPWFPAFQSEAAKIALRFLAGTLGEGEAVRVINQRFLEALRGGMPCDP